MCHVILRVINHFFLVFLTLCQSCQYDLPGVSGVLCGLTGDVGDVLKVSRRDVEDLRNQSLLVHQQGGDLRILPTEFLCREENELESIANKIKRKKIDLKIVLLREFLK